MARSPRAGDAVDRQDEALAGASRGDTGQGDARVWVGRRPPASSGTPSIPCSSAAVMRRSTATFHAGSIIDTEAAKGPAAVTITSAVPTSVVPATAAMWIRPSGRSATPRTTMVPPPMTLPSTGTWRRRCPLVRGGDRHARHWRGGRVRD